MNTLFDDLTKKFYWLSQEGKLVETISSNDRENGARVYTTFRESVLTYHTLGLAMELKQS